MPDESERAPRKPRTREARAVEQRPYIAAAAMVSELAIMRMAVGLGMSEDPVTAARLAGVTEDYGHGPVVPSEQRCIELAARARSDEFSAAREGRTAFAAQIYARFLALNALTLIEREQMISASQRPLAARMAQQTLDALGGSKLVWARVSVSMGKKREA